MLNENAIEIALINQLVEHDYTYHYGPDIAPYSTNPQRESFESVVLEKQFTLPHNTPPDPSE